MTTVRVNKRKDYFTTSNEAFNDPAISWEASGVMGYLLSKPDGWKVRMHDLENQRKCGNYKMRRILSELRTRGYINRIRIALPDGTFDWVTDVYESPSINPNPSIGIVKKTKTAKAQKEPSRSALVQEALTKHFSITLNPTFKAHKDFLVWAVDTAHMTPDLIEFARKTWDSNDQINWQGKRTISLKSITEEWLNLVKSFKPKGESKETVNIKGVELPADLTPEEMREQFFSED